jgi:hypothetical protein
MNGRRLGRDGGGRRRRGGGWDRSRGGDARDEPPKAVDTRLQRPEGSHGRPGDRVSGQRMRRPDAKNASAGKPQERNANDQDKPCN